MVHLTDKDIIQEQECPLEIGTEFWQEYEGLTMTGFGKICKCWTVEEYIMNGYFFCRLLKCNTVSSINPDYRKKFHINEIKDCLK